MPAQVECRSEYQYAQRPTAFTWEDRRFQVAEILASWRIPGGWVFRVEADGGRSFELIYFETEDAWEIRPSG